MANAIVLYTNKIKTTPATLTASSASASYPKGNVADDNAGTVWRSTAAGASAETIVADFGSAVSISACGLANVNFRSTATVAIQGHTADSWGAPDVNESIDATILDGNHRSLFKNFNSASKRYWRITVTDNGNPDGYLEIGEWWLGVHVQLTDNYAANHTRRLIRNDVQLRTEYNQAFVYSRDWAWFFDLPFGNVVEAVIDEIRALNYATQGSGLPFFWVHDPTAPAEAYFVRFASEIEESRVHFNRYNTRIQLAEEFPGLTVPR